MCKIEANTKYKVDTVKDWLGIEHKFVVCATVVDHVPQLEISSSDPYIGLVPVDDDLTVEKIVHVGHSTCAYDDDFDDDTLKQMAYDCALDGNRPSRWIAANCSCMITDKMLDDLLKHECDIIKKKPCIVIDDYTMLQGSYEIIADVIGKKKCQEPKKCGK